MRCLRRIRKIKRFFGTTTVKCNTDLSHTFTYIKHNWECKIIHIVKVHIKEVVEKPIKVKYKDGSFHCNYSFTIITQEYSFKNLK